MRHAAVLCWVGLLLCLAACGGSETPALTPTSTTRPNPTPMPVPEGWIPASVPISLDTAQNLIGLGRLDAPEPPSTIFAYALSLDSAMLAGLNNEFVLVWDLVTGELIVSTERNAVNAVFFGPDRSTIYALSNNGDIDILDAQTGSRIDALGAFDEYNGIWAYDPVGGWLALGSDIGAVQIWDMLAATSDIVLEMDNAAVTALAFSADGQFLAAGNADGNVELWKHEAGERVNSVDVPGRVFNVAFAPSGSRIAVNTARGVVLLDGETGEPQAVLTNTAMPGVFTFLGQTDTLVLGGEQSDFTLWDVSDASLAAALAGTLGQRPSIAVSPQGDMLIASTRSGSSLWNISQLANGTVLRGGATLPQSDILRVVWTPDGLQILAFEAVGPIRVYGIP